VRTARTSRRRAVAALPAIALAAALVLVALRPWKADEPPIHEPTGDFVASGPRGHAVVWAVGDGADGGRHGRAVAERIRAGHPDRFLYLGDVYGPAALSLLTGDGTARDYRRRYAPLYGALAPITAPTPGNHEWPQRGDGYEPYWRGVTGRTPPAWYGFRVAGWTLLSLNSEAPHGAGSAQLRWLAHRLARPGTCRLAFLHRPRFSAGHHPDDPGLAPLLDALRGHATLLVAGHDHNMQRFKPIGAITELVAGAGGHSHYHVDADPRLAFADDHSDGALRIDLRPGRARLRFVAAGGEVLDDSAVRCRQPSA
jgi:hypothetical protein